MKLIKRRAVLVFGSIVLAAGVIAAAAFAARPLLDTTLTFTLEDAVSRRWVWDATVKVQNREIRLFYQSDTSLRAATFTGLEPGPVTLSAAAPGYAGYQVGLRLRRGRNVILRPIELTGLAIPGLDHFTMVETPSDAGLRVELRPVDSRGNAIPNHPCLPIWAGARVSAEVAQGRIVRDSSPVAPARGAVLFNGSIEWHWNADPAATYRYVATLPWSSLADRTPFLVIDYLVVVPDPTKINAAELGAVMAAAPASSDIAALKAYLDQKREGERFTYYLSTSWNVSGS